MKKEGLEFRVGIFVVAAAAVLGFMVVRSGDFTMKPGYIVRMVFETVSGIDMGSAVKLAGVDVGEVKEIRVVRSPEGKTSAEVYARINQNVYIEDDAGPSVSTMGVLGDKYIEIIPGTVGHPSVGNGGTLGGHEPSNMDDLVNSGQRLIGKMSSVMDNINQVVGDEEFKTHAKGLFVNGDKVATNLAETSEDLKDTMKSAKIVMARLRDGEGTVGKLFKEDKIARDLEAFVADIKAHPWKLLKRN